MQTCLQCHVICFCNLIGSSYTLPGNKLVIILSGPQFFKQEELACTQDYARLRNHREYIWSKWSLLYSSWQCMECSYPYLCCWCLPNWSVWTIIICDYTLSRSKKISQCWSVIVVGTLFNVHWNYRTHCIHSWTILHDTGYVILPSVTWGQYYLGIHHRRNGTSLRLLCS